MKEQNVIENDGLILDAESWKNKENTTYTSILDLYRVSDLFSENADRVYEKKQKEEQLIQQELREYIFTDFSNEKQNDNNLVNYIFSEEVSISKIKTDKSDNGSSSLYTMSIGIVFLLLFGVIMYKYNQERKKRREKFATEIDMESIRTR